jgi:DNA repair exonuclease SbcCD ATPase subunit
MSAPPPVPPGIPVRFPPPRPAAPALVLRRRAALAGSASALSEASLEARKQISQVVGATHTPWAMGAIGSTQAGELEQSLRAFEARLAERERLVEEAAFKLAERERECAEFETLLAAREKILAVARQAAPAPKAPVSAEERAALDALKAALDRQEASLAEAKSAHREREQFLDESEARLFEKVQAQQEKETELEQLAEDLAAREQRLRTSESTPAPAAPPKAMDEFNE